MVLRLVNADFKAAFTQDSSHFRILYGLQELHDFFCGLHQLTQICGNEICMNLKQNIVKGLLWRLLYCECQVSSPTRQGTQTGNTKEKRNKQERKNHYENDCCLAWRFCQRHR